METDTTALPTSAESAGQPGATPAPPEVIMTFENEEPPAHLRHWIVLGLFLSFAAVCCHVAGIYAPPTLPVPASADSPEKVKSVLMYGERVGGLLAIASVFVLFAGYFLVIQKTVLTKYVIENGHRKDLDSEEVSVSSPAIRNCLLIATLIAFISCGANAVTTALHLWLYATLLLPLLGIAALFDFKFPSGWQGFSKFNEANPVFRIILLFTIAGGIGGFGFHVITNEGRVMLPSIGYVGYYVREPESPTAAGKEGAVQTKENTEAPSGKAVTGGAASGTNEKQTTLKTRYVRGANRNEALGNMTSTDRPYYIGLLDALFSGLLGDILIGMITANAIHLFVSGLMRYGPEGYEEEPVPNRKKAIGDKRYFDRQSLTIISLGILAGFCGPRLLPELAENVYKKENEQLRDAKKELEAGVKDAALASQVNPTENARSAALDVINREVWPYLRFNPQTAAVAASGSSIIDFDDVRFRALPEVAIVRMYRRLTNNAATTESEMLTVMNDAAISGAPKDYQVILNLLMGEFYARNKLRDKATTNFTFAAATDDTWMKTLALVRRTWVMGSDTDDELAKAEITLRSLKITSDLELPMDLARITLALLNASEEMKNSEEAKTAGDAQGDDETREDEEPDPTDSLSSTGIGATDNAGEEYGTDGERSIEAMAAEVVFFATALWDVKNWEKADAFIALFSADKFESEWLIKWDIVREIVNQAADGKNHPKLKKAILDLQDRSPGWSNNTATDKIARVNNFLKNATPPVPSSIPPHLPDNAHHPAPRSPRGGR